MHGLEFYSKYYMKVSYVNKYDSNIFYTDMFSYPDPMTISTSYIPI